uniref:Uncharacterized protein n=1 Tax=Oryza nivara TaxID=4536 RepID=A0A0E0I0Y1_ORYNI
MSDPLGGDVKESFGSGEECEEARDEQDQRAEVPTLRRTAASPWRWRPNEGTIAVAAEMAVVEPDSGRAHGYDNGSVEVNDGTAEAENGTRGSAGRRRRPVWCVRGGAGAHVPAETAAAVLSSFISLEALSRQPPCRNL